MPLMKLERSRRASPVWLEVGVAAGELLEQDAELELGQVVAEAEVRAAAAEPDVRVRVAADVEDVGVGEDAGVAVGGGVEDHDLVALA